MKFAELLAPAGSFEVFKAVIAAGADAVYMGLPKFSARAFAENTQGETYIDAIHYAHLHGKKLYCTINTLLKEKELQNELYELVKPLYEAGLDGVIVQDLGEMAFLYEHFPDLPLHASTQATVVGPGAYEYLKKLGIKRIVPARELSLKEIRRIHDEAKVELECFIHGALCYSYSGQCLFSSMVGDRSGNRGKCAQPCRMEYQVLNEGGERVNNQNSAYVLSLKDLNTLKDLPALLNAGIYSLKIEGRMKKAEYAAGVTSIYRKYLDRALSLGKVDDQGNFTVDGSSYRVDPADEKHLFDLFNRQGFTEGYYHRHNGKEMVTLKAPDFRETDDEFIKTIRENYIQNSHRVPIRGFYEFRLGQPYKLTLEYRVPADWDRESERNVRAEGQREQNPEQKRIVRVDGLSEDGVICEKATGRCATASDVEKQLSKLGDTDFFFESLEGVIEEGLFLPVSQLNNLRRQTISKLLRGIRDVPFFHGIQNCENRDFISDRDDFSGKNKNELNFEICTNLTKPPLKDVMKKRDVPLVSAGVMNEEQLKAVLQEPGVDRIYLDATAVKPQEYAGLISASPKEIYLTFPYLFRQNAEDFFVKHLQDIKNAGFSGFLISDLEELSFIRHQGLQGRIIANFNLYAFNSKAAQTLKAFGVEELIVPLELTQHEMQEAGLQQETLTVYGRAPMMISANCLHKTTTGCIHKTETWSLIDRKNNSLPVVNNCTYCMNLIFNGNPTSLLDLPKEVSELSMKNLLCNFTVESGEETRNIIRKCLQVFKKNEFLSENIPNFTHGHFKRGV